jgi:hypothetical protein
MTAEQGPLWGCDPECVRRADTTMNKLYGRIGGEVG